MRPYGVVVSGVVAACVALGVHAAPASGSASTGQVLDPGTRPGVATPTSALRVAPDLEPLRLPAFIPGQDDAIHLRETSGHAVTLRVTPVDEDGAPVDGGRVIVLRGNERRVVRLADSLPLDDLIGRRLVVETLRGHGAAEITAAWVMPAEAAAAATRRVPRKHLLVGTPTTSEELIDQAEAAGTLPHETAVLYHVYAMFGDARLPAAYRGDDSAVFESLYLDTVLSEWATYSAPTQAALKPFLMPPPYRGSWATPAGPGGAGIAHALGLPPICDGTDISGVWLYKENTEGQVRIWYDSAANDDAVAAFLATAADTKIWPGYVEFMGSDQPLSDADVSCNGGNGRLDIYLTDIDRSYTSGHTACGRSPAFIVLNRAIGAPTMAHEIFHAFQHAFAVQGDFCISSSPYRWWTEGSATWAEQYLYPSDDLALQQGWRLVRLPESPLDSVLTDNDRVYGTFLVPFYVQNAYFHGQKPTFVHEAWKNCASQDAIHAVDAAIPGGFAQIWPEVALYDWNDQRLAGKNYFEWSHYVYYQAKPQETGTIGAAAQPTWHYDLKLHLGHLSATYTYFDFSGPEIRSVAFFNGASFNLRQTDVPPLGPLWDPQTASPDKIKGVKVQAIVTIEGHAPKVEDWTDRPYVTFCRDMTEERLKDVTIIMSNARLDDSGGKVDPPNLAPVFQGSNFGCWQWKGTATYTEPVSGGTQTDTASVTFDRVAGPPQPPSITYTPTGTVTVAMSGQCAGGGTVPISELNAALDTYNFAPPGAAALLSYRGESAETAMVDITCQGHPGKAIVGPWFLILAPQPPQFPFYYVSNDGATMSGTYILNGITWHWDLHAQRQ